MHQLISLKKQQFHTVIRKQNNANIIKNRRQQFLSQLNHNLDTAKYIQQQIKNAVILNNGQKIKSNLQQLNCIIKQPHFIQFFLQSQILKQLMQLINQTSVLDFQKTQSETRLQIAIIKFFIHLSSSQLFTQTIALKLKIVQQLKIFLNSNLINVTTDILWIFANIMLDPNEKQIRRKLYQEQILFQIGNIISKNYVNQTAQNIYTLHDTIIWFIYTFLKSPLIPIQNKRQYDVMLFYQFEKMCNLCYHIISQFSIYYIQKNNFGIIQMSLNIMVVFVQQQYVSIQRQLQFTNLFKILKYKQYLKKSTIKFIFLLIDAFIYKSKIITKKLVQQNNLMKQLLTYFNKSKSTIINILINISSYQEFNKSLQSILAYILYIFQYQEQKYSKEILTIFTNYLANQNVQYKYQIIQSIRQKEWLDNECKDRVIILFFKLIQQGYKGEIPNFMIQNYDI